MAMNIFQIRRECEQSLRRSRERRAEDTYSLVPRDLSLLEVAGIVAGVAFVLGILLALKYILG